MKSLSQHQQNCQINTSSIHSQNTQTNTTFKCKFYYPASIVFQAPDILLIAKKFQIYSSKCKITTEIVRPNGSKYLIPAQYHNCFVDKIQRPQIIFFPIKAHSWFVIGLDINFVSKDSQIFFDQSQLQQILQNIQICQNFLTFVGLIKSNIKSSLQIHRSQIKLKKELLKLIPNYSFKFNVLYTNNGVSQNQINVLPVKFIQQVRQSNIKENRILKAGDYFTIQDKQCEVTKLTGQKFVKHLVKKKLRVSQNLEKYKKKLVSELNFVREIKSNRYIVQYYFQQASKDHFYMDCIKDNLKGIIYSKDNKLKIDSIFSITKQLIEALNILHQSGIVHRDIKLQNILIQTQSDCLKLKLIDFADSAFINASFDKNLRLGCTTPYSPVECLIATEEGFNKYEIDLWSVIMVIYQIIFRQSPFFYSHALQQQLVEGWKGDEDFSTILSHRHKKGIRKLEEYVSLLTQQSLKIQQKQRLKLEAIMPFIETLQIFYQQMCQKFLKTSRNFHE